MKLLTKDFYDNFGSSMSNFLYLLRDNIRGLGNPNSPENQVNHLEICCEPEEEKLLKNRDIHTTYVGAFRNESHLILKYQHLKHCAAIPIQSYIQITHLVNKLPHEEFVYLQNKTWCYPSFCINNPCLQSQLTEHDFRSMSNTKMPNCKRIAQLTNYTFKNGTHTFIASSTPLQLTGPCLNTPMHIQVALVENDHSCNWELEQPYISELSGQMHFFNANLERDFTANTRQQTPASLWDTMYNYVILVASLATILTLIISVYMFVRNCVTSTTQMAYDAATAAATMPLRSILKSPTSQADYDSSSSSSQSS